MERTKLHRLSDILVIALCAVLAGASSWEDIALFGAMKWEWFTTFLALPHGIPSHDTYNRVFAALAPAHFEQAFTAWVQHVVGDLPPQVIALDGKTLRGSRDTLAGTPALHLVSAWASTSRLILAQVAVREKSNEITALPEVLARLDLTGGVMTIDAMGCQRAIAQQIVWQGGQYVLAVKDNQSALPEDVQQCFAAAEEVAYEEVRSQEAVQMNKGHGRVDIRRHTVITEPSRLARLQAEQQWPALAALGHVQSERRFVDGRCEQETRYYLLSQPLTASAFGAALRSHWVSENQVHWVLAVTFGEDRSRKRAGQVAHNFILLLRLALNLLRLAPSKKGMSLNVKRLRAGKSSKLG